MDWQDLFNVGYLQVIFTLIAVFILYNILEYLKDKVVQNPSQFLSTKRRLLDNVESLFDLISLERQGTGNICLVVSLRSKTKLIKEYVQNALMLLAKRQPMLRAIITTSANKEKHFEIIDGDEITGMIDFTSCNAKARQWKDVWHEVTSKQRGTGLLWKAVMLQEEFLSETTCYANTLLFNFSHCAIDGVSSMKFCQQFLYYLNGLADGSLTSDEDISSLSLSPSFIELATPQRSWSLWKVLAICLGVPRISKLLKTHLRHLQSRKQCNPFFVQFPVNLPPSCSPWTSLISNVFSETETSNIVKACRLRGCTVTGALMAASHLAYCELIREGNFTGEDVYLEHKYAINGQRHCQPKPPEDYLGNIALANTFFMKYTLENEADFWVLALEATKQIRCDVKEEQYLKEYISIFESLSPEEIMHERFSPAIKQDQIRLSFCNLVSSIGAFDLKSGQENYTYRLHECLFSFIQHGFTATFIHHVTTVNGKMAWVISFDETIVSNREHAEKFAKLCFDYFVDMAN